MACWEDYPMCIIDPCKFIAGPPSQLCPSKPAPVIDDIHTGSKSTVTGLEYSLPLKGPLANTNDWDLPASHSIDQAREISEVVCWVTAEAVADSLEIKDNSKSAQV